MRLPATVTWFLGNGLVRRAIWCSRRHQCQPMLSAERRGRSEIPEPHAGRGGLDRLPVRRFSRRGSTDAIADPRETREPAATGAADLSGQKGPELCVVVPTFNERDNVDVLVGRLERTLRGIAWEVVFVDDDSPDGTAEHIRALGERDPRIRCIR